jgi:hypothetical protein
MISRRARDLGLLTSKGVLDMDMLTYMLWLREHTKATAVMEVCACVLHVV